VRRWRGRPPDSAAIGTEPFGRSCEGRIDRRFLRARQRRRSGDPRSQVVWAAACVELCFAFHAAILLHGSGGASEYPCGFYPAGDNRAERAPVNGAGNFQVEPNTEDTEKAQSARRPLGGLSLRELNRPEKVAGLRCIQEEPRSPAVKADGQHRVKHLCRARLIPQARLTVDLGAPFAVPLRGNCYGELDASRRAKVLRRGRNPERVAC